MKCFRSRLIISERAATFELAFAAALFAVAPRSRWVYTGITGDSWLSKILTVSFIAFRCRRS
jgi:hypothetical protein